TTATLIIVFSNILLRTPTSTLFPYTTLFRSPHPTLSHYEIFSLSTDAEYTLEVLRTNPSLTPARMILSLAPAQLRELEKLSLRRSEEHTSELQSRENLVCRLLLEKKKKQRSR